MREVRARARQSIGDWAVGIEAVGGKEMHGLVRIGRVVAAVGFTGLSGLDVAGLGGIGDNDWAEQRDSGLWRPRRGAALEVRRSRAAGN